MNQTDNALMWQVSKGQVAVLAVLFERHHRPLFRYFLSMQRDRAASEDLVQEVFLRILRYRATYDAEQSFTAWMYQIARNTAIDQVRRGKPAEVASKVVDIDEFAERQASAAPGPEETAQRGENMALLYRALDRLPDDKREILVLSRFQQMKYEDIAAVLGCEVGTVKVRVFRAMRALEQTYSALLGEKAKENAS